VSATPSVGGQPIILREIDPVTCAPLTTVESQTTAVAAATLAKSPSHFPLLHKDRVVSYLYVLAILGVIGGVIVLALFDEHIL
jgi:hypothetical protein